MNETMRLCLIALCLAMLPSCSRSTDASAQQTEPAATPPSAAEPSESGSADRFKTFIGDLRAFAGSAQVVLPGDEEASPSAVADRIVMGFEQDPPRKLKLDDGSVIYWGWQEGQAFIKSIAVYDPEGRLRLVGAVDDIPQLFSRRSDRAIANEKDYQELLSKQAGWGSSPSVALFVEEAPALETYYPLVKRWLQAAMLGFNADCSKPGQAPTCAFVQQVTVPTVAYSLKCDKAAVVNQCALPIPDVPAASIELQEFRQ
jgi:hypothetical protein